MDADSIRDKAHEVLITGKLPARVPDRSWGGPGSGEKCSICKAPVPHDEVEFELEFVRAEGVTTHHIHVACFTAWECERDALNLAQDRLKRSA